VLNHNHLDNLEIITRAPNGIKLLRQLILKHAISGKLVTQNLEEGTGIELITKIFDERGIEVGAENNPTLSIPTNWGRAKLGEIFHLEMGQSPNSDSYNSGGEGLPFYQGKTDFGSFVPIPRVWCSSPTKVAEVGDVLLSVRAPVGPTNYADEKCCIGRGLAAVRPLGGMQTEFVLWWLRAYESQIAEMGTGTTFIAVSKKNLEPFMMAIPPLAEQSRILDKLNELMKQCDILESQLGLQDSLSIASRNSAVDAISTAKSLEELQIAWDRIQLNWEVMTETPDSVSDLRRLIETLGIRGQLTEKLNLGDTAEDLLKDLGLNESVFTIDEMDIVPMNWAFTNLGAIIQLDYGKSLPKQIRSTQGKIPVYGSNGIVGYHDEALVENGSIVVGRKGSIGQVNIARGESWIIDTAYYVVPKAGMSIEYLALLIKTSNLQSLNKATAIPGLNRNDAYSQRCFLAPPEEQIRIVQTVNALLEVCDRLAEALQERENIALQFARSVVSESA
jgi:type I restriction enzyme S subunit